MIQRRAVEVLFCSFALLIALAIAGCGGGNSNKVGPATTITVSPSRTSLEFGRFVTLVASATDANGKAVDPSTITWSSNNTAVATVTSTGANGSVCAGTWDSLTAPTVCTPTTTQASVTITATSGTASASVLVNVYPHIARVVVTPLPANTCTSQSQTVQMNAQAFDSNNNLIPTLSGSFSWSVTDSNIATVDGNGVVTAKRPGITAVNALLANTTGQPQAFITCPPAQITIGQQGNPTVTDFSLSTAQTATLAASVTDTRGNAITDIALTFSSSAPGVASTSTNGLNGTVTANAPGRAGVIASCTPPACNPGFNRPVYSNVASFTVTGSSSPAVVVGSASSNSVAVINSNNTVSAAVAIPTVTVNGTAKTPVLNSVVVSGDGSKAFFGSDVGVLQFDLSTNAFLGTVPLFAGKVLVTSADGTKVGVTNGATFTVIDVAANTSTTYAISNATAADLSQDAITLFATSGSELEAVNRVGTAVNSVPLATTGSDVKFLKQSSVAFVAESAANAEIFASCTFARVGSVAAQPQLLASTNDSSRIFGANATTIYSIVPTVTPPSVPTPGVADCAPSVSTTVASAAIGATVAPGQLLATPNGGRAVLLADATSVFIYDSGSNGVTAVPLSGGSTPTTGGITPDSATLYVGTSAGDVQRIDVASGVVMQSINVGLKKADGTTATPDFVAVRSR